MKDHLVARGLRLAARDPAGLLRGVARKAYRLVSDFAGDVRFGIWTGIWKPKFGGTVGRYYGYEPAPYSTLHDVREHIRLRDIRARTFIDLGCGYARPLYYFAADFDRLVGYEINPNIYEPAREQLERRAATDPRYSKIAILNSDAAQALTYDTDLVAFMYNPFGADAMRQLGQALADYRHAIHLYYVNPVHADVLEECLGSAGTEFSSFMKVRYFNKPARGLCDVMKARR